MQTLAYMAIGLGFYIHRSRSSKVQLAEDSFMKPFVSKWARFIPYFTLGFFLLAYALLIYLKGVGAGSMDFFLVLMSLGSLTILLAPLKLPSPVFYLILLISLVGLEFMI